MSVTGVGKETTLERIPYIHYSVQFQKDKTSEVQALINSGSEVNAMSPAYAKKLGLWIQKTDVGVEKIDGSTLETFGMIIASF